MDLTKDNLGKDKAENSLAENNIEQNETDFNEDYIAERGDLKKLNKYIRKHIFHHEEITNTSAASSADDIVDDITDEKVNHDEANNDEVKNIIEIDLIKKKSCKPYELTDMDHTLVYSSFLITINKLSRDNLKIYGNNISSYELVNREFIGNPIFDEYRGNYIVFSRERLIAKPVGMIEWWTISMEDVLEHYSHIFPLYVICLNKSYTVRELYDILIYLINSLIDKDNLV